MLTGPAHFVFLLPETESNFTYEYSGAYRAGSFCVSSPRDRVILHTNTVVLTGPAHFVFLLPETE